MALLEVRDLSVRYGPVEAVKGVSLDVEEGEIAALIGANGAGKSTMLHALSGIVRPAAGRIIYGGREITRLAAHEIVRSGLVQVPEGRAILTSLTVGQNLALGAFPRRDRGAAAQDLAAVFRRFPVLERKAALPAGSLSGGEQQLLAIGRALMARPKLLLLDEPSMGLAPLLVKEIFDIIREINAAGTAVLLVEQNARAALAVSSRGYVLETGRIALQGAAAGLLHDPQVIAAYLGA
jgi:branched-chain amino acid transport system ATP-binding protein